MDRPYKASNILGFVIISCFALPIVSHGQALPEGKGKADFQRICSSCHTVVVATRLRNNSDGWKNVVDEMVSRGAQGSQAELDNIVLYLSTNFGADGSTAHTPVSTPSQQPAAINSAGPVLTTTLSPTAVSNAKRVIAQNGCTACHRVANEGSYIGPSLDDVGTRRKPDEIRAAIVSPAPKVQPENRQVRIVTQDGKAIAGKILNQDGYSVQMVNGTGQLTTYQKSSLREFSIVDTNPMPSFGKKVTGQDLDDLVRYLGSFTEPGQ